MPKKKSRTIADRKERLTSMKKKARSISEMLDESMKPSRSFKEAGAIAIGALGPGKIKKAGQVAKKVGNALKSSKSVAKIRKNKLAPGTGQKIPKKDSVGKIQKDFKDGKISQAQRIERLQKTPGLGKPSKAARKAK